MNGKKARASRAAQAQRAQRDRIGVLDFDGCVRQRFIRPIVPGEFGQKADDWIPRGATHVEVVQWCDPVDGAVLAEMRTALPPGGHGRALCVVEAHTPEAARAAPLLLPATSAIGSRVTAEGTTHPLWAYSVDLP